MGFYGCLLCIYAMRILGSPIWRYRLSSCEIIIPIFWYRIFFKRLALDIRCIFGLWRRGLFECLNVIIAFVRVLIMVSGFGFIMVLFRISALLWLSESVLGIFMVNVQETVMVSVKGISQVIFTVISQVISQVISPMTSPSLLPISFQAK